MRSTRDVIIAAKDGLAIAEDELRMALLVMAAVDAFTWRELYELIEVIEQDRSKSTVTGSRPGASSTSCTDWK
jgi:hypothetical protein